ncbi:MAG: acyl-CoA dehydrogenase [Hydrocarboniphaga sp.]|nr:acyl-CoA dehydrogenase [Hydrocarboniphaga sp.]MDB5967745.1 acyl-CoA dehydrogenase [Hydrocarboniphaga sp.]
MNLSLSNDQQMIRDAAESFLAAVSDSAAVRRAMDSPQGYDETVWLRIASELGWCALAIPESFGGLGLGPVEQSLVMESIGRHLLCAPYFSTAVLAATLLDALGCDVARESLLPKIAQGSLRISAPLPAEVDWRRAGDRVAATSQGAQWRLSGSVARMPDAAGADTLLVLAACAQDVGLFAVDAGAAGVAIRPLQTWDGTRRLAAVELSGVIAQRLDDPSRAADGYRKAAALVRLYLAAEALGGAQQCLDLTVRHVGERRQFGRVVGAFQAVKHRCAEMMVKIEALRSAVAGAAAFAAASDDPAALEAECAMARALSIDTYFFCAAEAIQLHGGVGFTWDYDPQLYFKRAQASAHWLGTADALREQIAAHILSPLHEPCADRRAGLDPPLLPGLDDGGSRPALRGFRVREEHGASQELALADRALGKGRGEDESFRNEIASWMYQHLSGRYASLKHRGGPGDEEADPALRKQWERELAAGGWTCVGWPAEAGGRALPIAQQVIFFEEYARAGGPGRMGHIGEGLIGPTLIRFGSAAQQQRFLPEIVAGREFWAQGYSEPNAGSDLANVQTRCWQIEDGSWRVSGQKIWTSLAHQSDWIFVLARSEPGSRGSKGLSFLLLPLKQPGIEIRPIRQLGGGAEFNEVFFDEAVAEAGHIVGAPGDGWRVAMALLEAERGVSTLGQQMHFAHEFELVVQAARDAGRVDDPLLRQRLALAWSGLRVMRYNALRMLGSGADPGLKREALIYKYYWSNWHRDLGKLGMDVLGVAADELSDDDAIRPLQQLFFFSRADTIYAGTNEIQLNLIAERGLGLPREARPLPPLCGTLSQEREKPECVAVTVNADGGFEHGVE